MQVTFLQTADPVAYRSLIEITSQTVREYCARSGAFYECFLGIRRGSKPWHAALNRIPILKEYMDRGYRGWVVYIDADAYIADLDFDLRAYLSDKSDYGMIAAPSGQQPPKWWQINNGVFALNLGHEAGRRIVQGWYERLDRIPVDVLASEKAWGDVIDDQDALLDVFQSDPEFFERHLYLDEEQPNILNWNGVFIRQIVRNEARSLEHRAFLLKSAVDSVMGVVDVPQESEEMRRYKSRATSDFVLGVYRALLGREPDPHGFDAVYHKLRQGSIDYEAELKSCMASDEFKTRILELAQQLDSSRTGRA